MNSLAGNHTVDRHTNWGSSRSAWGRWLRTLSLLAAVLFGASALVTLPARATGPGPTNIDFASAVTIDFPGAIRTNDRGTATGGVWFKFEAPVSGPPSIQTLAQVGRKGFAVYDSTGQPYAGDFIAHHEYRVRVNSPIPGPPGPTNPSINGSFRLRVGYAGSVDSDSDGVSTPPTTVQGSTTHLRAALRRKATARRSRSATTAAIWRHLRSHRWPTINSMVPKR